MRLIAELTRRNVLRVAVAYLVGSWLLIQVSDILFAAFVFPAWTMRALIIALAIGLPVTLLVSWVFELTPDGFKRESEIDRRESVTLKTGKKLNNAIVVLLALAVVYLLLDKFYLQSLESVDTTATAEHLEDKAGQVNAQQPKPVDPASIAVLPFDNRSRLAEDEFFVEGIHDDLLTNLAQIGSLKVISRTSVGKFRETQKTIPEIAAELGVATVMEGAVQRSARATPCVSMSS
jgi:hypothetical protein